MSGAAELEVVTFPSLAELRRRLPRLLVGIGVISVGISLVLEARLGVSPWDVLHQGLSDATGLSFGAVVVAVGLVVLVLWIPIRQRVGIGTVINTFSIGFIVDACRDALPRVHEPGWRWLMLIGGIVIAGVGVGLYIGAGLGSGPRDGLMTGLAAKGYPLWIVRTVLELSALGAGWVLGGDVGAGTVLFAFSIGPLGHWFLQRLHLGVGGVDPDPQAAVGE